MTGLGMRNQRRTVHAEVLEPVVTTEPGQPATVQLEVRNLGTVIQAFDIAVLGLDAAWVSPTPHVVDLFPDEAVVTTIVIQLPDDHPAGRHTVSIQVEAGTRVPPLVVDVVLEISPRSSMLVTTEPTTLEVGGRGDFLVHLSNTGNTLLDVDLLAQDPERLVTVEFDPATNVLQPGSQAVVRATATGPRPWFGLPEPRILDVTATAGEVEAATVVALLVRPRISRRFMAFLGLLMMISLFALVISLSFREVAEVTERNQELVQQGLGFDEASAERVAPAAITGSVLAATGGGIDGAAVELYDQANVLRPVQSTVTNDQGEYEFAGVADGSYLIRLNVAGFGELWHPGVVDLADAEPIEVADGAAPALQPASLSGQPGSVSGTVVGLDVAGALLTVRLPADTIQGSDVEPVPAIVQEIELDATGTFSIGGLSTPATYEIAVTKPGFADDVSTITLGPGEQREEIEILLSTGIGVITGTVVDGTNTPLGGVDIVATDGTTETRTRSLGGAEDRGTFELRDLDVPTVVTLTASAPGFFTETRTVTVTDGETPPLTIVLTADRGSVGGLVTDASGDPLGALTVTVTGADLELSTRTLSVGAVGRWSIAELPTPGTYTVTVTDDRYVTNAVAIELQAGPGSSRTDVDFRMIPALASLRGQVIDVDGDPISGTQITLEGSEIQRVTTSADDPAGAYVFDRVPAGVYTLTFRRPGSTVQTLLVDLPPGDDRVLPDVALEAQAIIEGVVRDDGVGQSDVGVLVYRADDFPGQVTTSTVTGPGGTFRIEGLEAPESYIVEFRVPAGGSAVTSRSVELLPDETVQLEINL